MTALQNHHVSNIQVRHVVKSAALYKAVPETAGRYTQNIKCAQCDICQKQHKVGVAATHNGIGMKSYGSIFGYDTIEEFNVD